MAWLYWDGPAGAAGDMLLASLLDAGAEWTPIEAVLRTVLPGDWTVAVGAGESHGLRATRLTVHDPHEEGPAHPPHDHGHDHGHAHGHDHGPAYHRHLADLLAMARHPAVPARAGARAERVFRALAEAEGRVHGKAPEAVHFHELSGVDTVIDVLGVMLALEQLDVEAVYTAAPFAGSGTVRCAHGVLPVPAPAVAELMRASGMAYRSGGADGELLTPTGAALLAVLADGRTSPPPPGRTLRIGYGAGTKVWPDRPNMVRATLGVTMPAGENAPAPCEDAAAPAPPAGSGWDMDTVLIWESVVDDMTPEAVGAWFARVFEAGALDAFAAPVTMKKNRPGWALAVLAHDDRAASVADTLARATTAFGWRVRRSTRWIMSRAVETVTVDGHAIRVKIGRLGDEIVRRQPEFEDCRMAAHALGQPLEAVFARAMAAES